LRIVFSFLVLAAAAFGGSINIVQNGGFETGDFTGWTINQLSEETWRISGDPHTGTWGASTGCVGPDCITGEPTSQNSLSQMLSTNAGDSYALSFFYDPGRVETGSGISELLVQWGGTTVADLLIDGTILLVRSDISTITPAPGYNIYTVSGLMATSTSTQLTFLGRQDPSFSLLDDIVVTDNSAAAAPEPSSYALAAGGLLVLAIAAVRRSSCRLMPG
jgi:hypothetical protein